MATPKKYEGSYSIIQLNNDTNVVKTIPAKEIVEPIIMASLQHPNIMSSISIEVSKQSNRIIMPYAEMDLTSKLYSTKEWLTIFNKICDAVGFLHQHRILHLDLKPANIVIDKNEPKIIDFGSALFLPGGVDRITVKNRTTKLYLAPESDNKDGTYTFSYASDVWSLGVMFVVVLGSRSEKFRDLLEKGLVNPLDFYLNIEVMRAFFETFVSPDLVDECCSIITKFLHPDPTQRIKLVSKTAGSIKIPIRYSKSYKSDHREYLKQLYYVMKNQQLTIEEFFYTTHLYYLTTDGSESRMFGCLMISNELFNRDDKLIDSLIKGYNKEFETKITKSEVSEQRTKILMTTQGVVFGNPLFDRANNESECRNMISDVILTKQPETYFEFKYEVNPIDQSSKHVGL